MIRKEKVILDQDLADLYGVETRAVVQAVKRNKERFPKDFMFQLSDEEFKNLKSQIVTSSWGGRRTAPYAFTEQGVAMLSSVLRSKRAVQVNIEIMRTFVKLQRMLESHEELSRKLMALEKKYDSQLGHYSIRLVHSGNFTSLGKSGKSCLINSVVTREPSKYFHSDVPTERTPSWKL